MVQFDFKELEINFYEIMKLLEDTKEDGVIVNINGKPTLKITLFNEDDKRNSLFGCAKGMFEIPDNFDDIDISGDFKEGIFPQL